jgi:hypothetical protein
LSGALLTGFAVGGGIPPATYEALRVHEDGVVRAVVGNAWPFGTPQDEAGSYEQRIGPDATAELARAVAAIAQVPEPAARLTADAGRCQLAIGDERRIAWSTSEEPPEALVPLVERLRELLTATRRHPVGALALALEPVAATAGEPFVLGLVLHNPGSEAIRLRPPDEPGRLRVRVSPADGRGRPDLEALVAADALAVDVLDLPAELGPGERVTVAGRGAIAAPGHWRLDVLARLDADVPYEGEPLRLECVALAGPAVVDVGP